MLFILNVSCCHSELAADRTSDHTDQVSQPTKRGIGQAQRTEPMLPAMGANVSIRNPARPRRVIVLASNPTVSQQTGWPIGFWWGELSHTYWERTEHGYSVTIASPDGGRLQGDSWNDPRHASGYSIEDLLSRDSRHLPRHVCPAQNRLSDGRLLVDGKTWTGFANSEEDYADAFVQQQTQSFRIEDEA